MYASKIKSLYRFISPKFQSLHLDYPVNPKPRYGYGRNPHSLLYKIIDKNRSRYSEFLTESLKYSKELQEIKINGHENDPTKPVYNNGFLPGLDIFGIYSILAKYRPQNYIEIGSGNSTKVAYKAKVENNLETKIISIDPAPRVEIDKVADTIIRQPFETINFDLIFSLQENDILFIDNSHRILPNSDSMVFFLEILPNLKTGVIVHIHDIYLPYDYPQFMCDRFYSEQYGLAMYLLANPEKFNPVLPNYFISQDKQLSALLHPLWSHSNLHNVEKHGGSFWMIVK